MSRQPPKPGSASLAAAALADLAADRLVQLDLPGGGHLRIERPLPFLCVYRRSGNGDDGAEQLLTGEPTYAILPSDPGAATRAIRVLRKIVEHLAQQFGSFLLLELWPAPPAAKDAAPNQLNGDTKLGQRFEIIAHGARIPRATIEALSISLGRDALPFGGTRVVLGPYGGVAPAGMKPIVPLRELKLWNCFVLGVVVHPATNADESQHDAPAGTALDWSQRSSCAGASLFRFR